MLNLRQKIRIINNDTWARKIWWKILVTIWLSIWDSTILYFIFLESENQQNLKERVIINNGWWRFTHFILTHYVNRGLNPIYFCYWGPRLWFLQTLSKLWVVWIKAALINLTYEVICSWSDLYWYYRDSCIKAIDYEKLAWEIRRWFGIKYIQEENLSKIVIKRR